MHPRAGNRLDRVVDALAIDEHIEDGRRRAGVLRQRAVEQQMAGDAEEFREHHPDALRAVGHGDAAELLDGQKIRHLADDAAEIIDPVGIGDVSVPGLALCHLLGAAMMVADVRIRPDDLLAVEPEHDPENAVGRGMVRTEVQHYQLDRVAVRGQAEGGGVDVVGRFGLCEALGRHAAGRFFGGARLMVLRSG